MDNYYWAAFIYDNMLAPSFPECPYCSAEIIDENDVYCSVCGRLLKEEKEKDIE